MPTDRLWGWIGPLLVTAFAGFLRFYRLSAPNAIIFDETYYAKDAWSILQHGVEWNWATFFPNANTQIIAGHTNFVFHCSGTACAEYVVQPPVGKLLIAVGEWLYGLNSLGWRVAPALVRDAGDPGHVPRRPANHQVDAARLPGRAAALVRRARVRAQPDRHPRHLPDVLRARLVRRPGGRPGRLPGPAGRGGGARSRATRPGPRSGSGSGGWRPGCSSASPAPPSSTRFWYILAFAGLCIAWDIGARRTVGAARLRPRRAGPRRQVAADHARGHPAGHLRRHLDRLVRHVDRLRPELRPAQRGQHPDHLAAVLAVRVPQGDAPVRRRAERAPPVRVPAVGLVPDDPPGRVLLGELHQRGRHGPGQVRDDRPVGVGGAGDRQPRDLVAVDSRHRLLPGLVAHPPGLAGGRRRARRRGRLGDAGCRSPRGPSSSTTRWSSSRSSSSASCSAWA